MYQQSIPQKFQSINNQLILDFVVGSTISGFEDSEIITNAYSHESSKFQGIKYFHFADTINGFLDLQYNWDSYNADVVSQDAVNIAIEILNHLNSKGFLSNDIEVSVFPMRDGGIQFEFDGKNICAELEINQSGEMTFILFDKEGNIVDKGQLFESSELSTLLEEAQYA